MDGAIGVGVGAVGVGVGVSEGSDACDGDGDPQIPSHWPSCKQEDSPYAC